MVTEARPIDVSRIYTNAEFEALPAEFENYELIRGRLVEKMASGNRHGRIARRIVKRLDAFDFDETLGVMWFNTTFRVGPGFEPKSDLGFIGTERIPEETDAIIPVRPDLAVEVHSPSDMNTKGIINNAAATKISDYLKYGVRIVWAINPKLLTVEIYHFGQSDPAKILTIGDTLDGEDVIPGFTMAVANLFS